jgi:hypothetical protein
MYCKHCGKEIAIDSKFCKFCGNGVADSSNQESSTPKPNLTNEKISELQSTNTPSKKGNRLAAIFLWSVLICVCCTLGYATIRYEDSKPYDSEHYWGFSAYDPGGLMGINYQDHLTWIREDKYKDGIRTTAIYSFPIAFGVLVLGAILTGTMNKK